MGSRGKILLFLILILMAFWLVGCGTDVANPEEVVADFWEKYQAGDYDELNTFFAEGVDSERTLEDMGLIGEEEEMGEEVAQALKDKMDLITEDHEINGEEALVFAVYDMPDFEYFFSQLFMKGLEVSFSMALAGASDEEIQEKMNELMLEILEDIPIEKIDHEITLIQEGNDWKFTGNPFPEMELDDFEAEL